MDCVTLHELSLQLDISVRVLRSRLKQLLLAGKLTENVDCKREGYVDETHFTWLVNPEAFIRAAGLRPANRPVTPLPPTATQPVSPPVNPVSHTAAQPVDQPAPRRESPPPTPEPTTPTLEREMITILKDQIRVKDTQIADLSGQNKALNELHLKLTGQIVRQADRIQTLLRLTGGKCDFAEMATQAGSQSEAPANPASAPATQPVGHASPFADHEPHASDQQDSALAA